MHRSLPTPALHRPFSYRCPLVHTSLSLPGDGDPLREVGSGGRAQTETRTAETISSCHSPGSQHLEPRLHARHTHRDSHVRTDTLTLARRPRPRPRPGPCGRPLRRSRTRRAARPGWREAAASGRFDFPAAREPRSPSPSRGGGARSRVPNPAAETQREAPQPLRSALPESGHPRSSRPIRPPTPLSLSCTLSVPTPSSLPVSRCPLHDSARPSRYPLPAPLRLSRLRLSSLCPLRLSAGPPASSSRHPRPLLYPRPPLPPPRFPLSLPTPPLRSPLSSLCRPAPAPELGESPGFRLLRRRRESRRDLLIWGGGRGGLWSSPRTWRR